MSSQGDAGVDQRLFDEWKTARDLISSLDGTLSDFRKFGFSFITAILAADSILGQTTQGATVVLSPEVKLAVFASTLVLIGGLYATDRFYRVVQKAAAKRAMQIEAHFGKGGLTTIVGEFYKSMHLWLYTELLYCVFAIACEMLSVIVLYPSYNLIEIMTASTILTVLFIIILPHVGGRPPNLYPSPDRKQPPKP